MDQTEQPDPRGTVEETAGCTCVVCVTSRANRRQAEQIKELQGAIDRVRDLCARPDYLTPDEVITALDGPTKQGERDRKATIGGKGHGRQTFNQRPIVQVDLPRM